MLLAVLKPESNRRRRRSATDCRSRKRSSSCALVVSSGTPVAGFTPNRVVSTAGTGNVTTDVSQRSKYGPTYMLGAQFTQELDSGKLWGGYSWSQAENKYRDASRGFLTGIGLASLAAFLTLRKYLRV